jgi:hypothetical protein
LSPTRLNADVQAITADADPNWRSNLRREVVQAAKQTNQPKEGRLVHPTRSNVHLKPPTPAELDRIRQHHNGIVTTAPGQPWTLLRAIVRRQLVEHEVHGRHVIAVGPAQRAGHGARRTGAGGRVNVDLEGMDPADVETVLILNLPNAVSVEGCPWDDTFTAADGALMMSKDAGQWRTINVAVEGNCEHVDTICSRCVDSWSNDWALRAVA